MVTKKKKFYLGEVKLPVTKCKKPSFSDHRGRTWDTGSIFIDGEKVDAHLDTTWGEYIYFQYDEKNLWHKVKMTSNYIDDLKGNKWDVNPVDTIKSQITTK